MTHLQLVPSDTPVTLWAGKRKLTLKPSDLEHYRGERGRRGLNCLEAYNVSIALN